MNITNFFEKSAPGRALIEKWEKSERQATDATRRTQFAELAAVNRDDREDEKGGRPGLQKANAELAKAHQLVKEKEAASARAHANARTARGGYERQRDLLEEALRETADPAISAAIQTMRGELDRLQHLPINSDSRPTGMYDRLTGRPLTESFSEAPTIKQRMVAVRAAIEELQALQLEAGVDISGRLEALRSDLPVIEMRELVA